MFFDKVLKQTVDILKSRVDDFSNNMQNWWSDLDDVRKKVNKLYKLDHHNTERPKVDILNDDMSTEIRHLQTNVWGLQEKVEKLEKKK